MGTSLPPIELKPKPPPPSDDLPFDDGEPMESERHRHQMNLLIDSLELAWADRDDVYVGGNMFVYFSETQAKKNDFRGPDVFVVLDTVKKERTSWVVWEEGGRTPDVVIELLSPSTEPMDRGEKMKIYARMLHVAQYYLFDPFTAALEGYELEPRTRSYRPLTPNEHGRMPVQVLGLSLDVVPGVFAGIDALWLRWIDENGHVLLHPKERADAEALRADAEALRADAEALRADAEALRATSLAEKLAEYERRYGKISED